VAGSHDQRFTDRWFHNQIVVVQSVKPSNVLLERASLWDRHVQDQGDLAAVHAVCVAVSKPIDFMVGINGNWENRVAHVSAHLLFDFT
jgi:hypothetical protein